MRARRLPAKAEMWVAIGLAFIVTLFGAAPAAQAGPSANVDHHISVTGELDDLFDKDHDHVGPSAGEDAPDAVADVLIPRMRSTLAILGLVLAVGLLWQLSPQQATLAGPDPPRRQRIVSPGRVVLSRLCISRR